MLLQCIALSHCRLRRCPDTVEEEVEIKLYEAGESLLEDWWDED